MFKLGHGSTSQNLGMLISYLDVILNFRYALESKRSLRPNIGAAPTTSFQLNTCLQWIAQRQLQDEKKNIYILGFGASYIRDLTVYCMSRPHDYNLSHKSFRILEVNKTVAFP